MDNTSWLQQLAVVYGSGAVSGEKRLMLRLEQRSFRWMEYLVAEISVSRDLMIDFCEGTKVVGKACLLSSDNQRFVWFEMEEGCFNEDLPSLVQVYTRQVRSSKSGFAPNENFFDAAWASLAEKDEK